MSAVFLKLLNLSITASWLILAVILVRLLLKKAPKWISCVLWALVAIRLVCPFSLESTLSLIPKTEWIPEDQPCGAGFFTPNADNFDVGALSELYPDANVSVSIRQPEITIKKNISMIGFLPYIWLTGVTALLLYARISYIRLKKSVGASIRVKDNILACDEVKSPFILGIVKPSIYVPSSMGGMTLDCVITHESAHIRRRDHWWKPLGFLLLAVYWFNPLCWLAYILLCRDIELACDETVVRDMDKDGIAEYSQALLNCSFPRRRIAACPLAFGEVGVKERVRSVLSYQKPAFWIIAAAAVACIAVAVCFLTDPKDREPDLSFLNYENACSAVADVTDVDAIFYPPANRNEDGKISIGYVGGNALARYLDSVSWRKRNAPREELPSPGSIEFCIRDDYRITIYQKPRRAMVTFGDKVRYYKTHGGDYDNAVSLFDPDEQKPEAIKRFDTLHGDEMTWDDIREINLDAFPPAADALREKYPEYFDLDTTKGLEVYVWQMAQNSYSFGVLSGTNRNKTDEELWGLKGASAEEMKAILSTYDIDEQSMIICPWQNPISSYLPAYWIIEEGEEQSAIEARRREYVDQIREMLFDGVRDP